MTGYAPCGVCGDMPAMHAPDTHNHPYERGPVGDLWDHDVVSVFVENDAVVWAPAPVDIDGELFIPPESFYGDTRP